MGKITGFMEFERIQEVALPVEERVRHYREFILTLNDEEAAKQGARCMDCGIPFCQSGCPINNIIPDWNDLVYRHQWRAGARRAALDQQLPRVHRPRLPGALRGGVHAQHQRRPGRHQVDRAFHHRQRLGRGLGRRRSRRSPRPASRSRWSAPVPRAWPARSSSRAPGTTSCCSRRTTASADCCATASPTSRWRSITSTAASSRCAPKASNSASGPTSASAGGVAADDLLNEFDAIAVTGGAEHPRDLSVPGRELDGVHFAMEFLPLQNRRVAGDADVPPLSAQGKHVVVIGGGDTGSDCVGTSNRQGAAAIVQFELLPQPPEHENKPLVWPYWPMKLRTSSSHEEGCQRDWAVQTKAFKGADGRVQGAARVPRRMEGRQAARGAGQRIRAQGRPGAVRHGLRASGARGNARATRRQVRRPRQRRRRAPRPIRPRCRGCSPRATRGAGNRWSSGPFAKAGNARGRSTNS